ncbi:MULTISPECIES: class E sortase [Streptomycetaceae]|uniref:Class E sortase n=1 Tax=Streptantibioticus cattleyicolor (strain ATCC 35852 / DSM 46488 / JCM 4925 / NBRC 14057 / NRRL 8057) TaxID=1003195 RepID=F8JSD8_STREN|nr:class E sortase [Streptantibioticus cattleyicolor]AEW95454.1 hypothetical protein SCATT_30830 [Streptantibioticus cattleyicolor NRRL 8057 = DSM 46488]MYS60021.1 class E sortase [Streptomyces sp. SID5468]CCB75795.1 conserved protein of unknown function [Streptantibioticus cattleyicolor NRRL 8057 = DSM 46488]
MTGAGPEHAAGDGPAYQDDAAFAAAVDRLADPLNDPLPGADGAGSPWFRPPAEQRPAPPPPAASGYPTPYGAPAAPYAGVPRQVSAPAYEPYAPRSRPAPGVPSGTPPQPSAPRPRPRPAPAGRPPAPRIPSSPTATAELPVVDAGPVVTEAAVTGGRAARRKAAKRGGRRARPRRAAGPPAPDRPPASRLEARRAARAAKDPLGVVVSRVVGELFITLGALMLLFVAYQLWWTNVLAHEAANGAASTLQHEWAGEHGRSDARDPGAFSPGQGFAIIYIPKLDVKAPIAEGVDKHGVLDRGMVGHYSGALETAMPWDKSGNFALAGHRNTHGEPFRYINKLVPGDKVVVETSSTYYTYEVTSFLPQTSPSNIGVIKPVPAGSGFTRPGRYITLTTCTPEFTSTYRMIVWGKMVEARPRSQGKPDALVQ